MPVIGSGDATPAAATGGLSSFSLEAIHRAIWMLPATDRYIGLACFCTLLVLIYFWGKDHL